MELFKKIISEQIGRLKTLREGNELYFIFFRLVQLTGIAISLYSVYALFLLRSVYTLPPIDSATSGLATRLTLTLSIWILLTLAASEIGLRLLDRNKIVGFYIGVALSLRYTFSFGFLLGIFGLYAFLNPSAQKRFLKDAPQWLKDLLALLKISQIEVAPSPNDDELL
jgi:hypothetical protein